MKKLLILITFSLLVYSCTKEIAPEQNNNSSDLENGISVVNGYLKFSSMQVFSDYLQKVKKVTEDEPSSMTKSSSTSIKIKGFTSIFDYNALKTKAVGGGEDDEEGDSTLIPDPILQYVLDTTLRIEIEGLLYKITEIGTFVVDASNPELLETQELEVDPSTLTEQSSGVYITEDGVTLIDSFGYISGESSTVNDLLTYDANYEDPYTPEAPTINNNDTYNIETYKWENTTFLGELFSWVIGRDVTRKNYFNDNNRLSLNLFQVNYGFYASTGLKVKLQDKHHFLGIPFWKQKTAEKIVIGIEELDGEFEVSSLPFNSYATSYHTFTSTIQNVVNNMFFVGFGKPEFLEDFVTDKAINVIAGVTNIDFSTWKQNPYTLTAGLTKDVIYGGLNYLSNKYVYQPTQKLITSKDPRIAYLFQGQSTSEKVHAYCIGTEEYSNVSSKTIRFSQSFGFTISWGFDNLPIVGTFIPVQFKINNVKIFGAAKTDNVWKGVRFIREE